MSRPSPKPALVAIVWQATDPAPRGWKVWLSRLLSGYLSALGHPRRGVTLLVGGDAALRKLNARHRDRDCATDILSFSYLPDPPTRPSRSSSIAKSPHPHLIGELAVSWNRVQAQAVANGWDARTELARLLAHGCVHLLGYDHATPTQDAAMRRIEERLLEGAGFQEIYPQRVRVASRRKRRARSGT